VDLQSFSGHRDTRMLLRYTHLCTPSLAKRLDVAFADQEQISLHRGKRRLKKGASITMKDISNAVVATAVEPVVAFEPEAAEVDTAEESLPSNVVLFRARRAA
jgi:hypothetical protein